ncbi:MAG: ACT domain-containing protein [Oscillospiraceae bacterium]|jgi:hypothetical protein|nr:ACT domain-containing protein [Oscillospiraceae bacterium]
MILRKLPEPLAVCRLAGVGDAPLDAGFFALVRTADEVSLVCPTDRVPSNATARDDGWRAFGVQGPLDFSLVGILADLTAILRDAGVPVFAVSTYGTDYILVKQGDLARAEAALAAVGHTVL